MVFSTSNFSNKVNKTARYANKDAMKTTAVIITFTARAEGASCSHHAANIDILLMQAPHLRKVKFLFLPRAAGFCIMLTLFEFLTIMLNILILHIY